MNRRKRRSVEERSAGLFVFSLLFCALSCFALAFLFGRAEPTKQEEKAPEFAAELPQAQKLSETPFLGKTADAGLAYQDRLTFFGESTTAHLKSRGVLSGGTATKQVLADESGTKRLSPRLPYESVIDPESGDSISLAELLSKQKPEVLVLSFGLNGIYEYAKEPDRFVRDYNALIDSIRVSSPATVLLLQSIYPVAKDSERFSNPEEVNRDIALLNARLPEIAASHKKVFCVDTASVLKDADGSLKKAFDNGDGYHLTASAYREILTYLRTHAWEDML